jgi:hypothetical protein
VFSVGADPKKNYNFVYSKFYVFRQAMRRQQILYLMIGNIARIQPPHNFLWNQVFICYRRSQTFDCTTISKHLLAIFMSWFCPAFWWRDSNMYLVLSVFTSRPTSSPVSITENKYMAMGPSGARCQEWPSWLAAGSKLLLCSALLCSTGIRTWTRVKAGSNTSTVTLRVV